MAEFGYQLLVDKLNEFIKKYYKNLLLKGIIYSVGLLLLFFIALTYAEYFSHFNTFVRSTLFYLFIVTSAYILITYIAAPLSKLYRVGNVLSYEEAANMIGKHFANVQDKLLNVLQLHYQTLTSNNSTSADYQIGLLEAGINQKIKELKPIPFTSAIDLKENMRYLKIAVIPLLFIVITLVIAPGIIADGAKRIVKHDVFFEKEAPFQFVILNENLTAIAQQDFELKIKLTGNEVPENVFININGNEFKVEKENNVKFSYLFKNVQADAHFQLLADGYTSKEYELQALPNPILLNFEIALVYPPYTNKKNEVLKNTGDLSIPSGTKVTWTFNTQNTQLLNLHFNDASLVIPASSENTYSYSSRFFKNKTYSVATSNNFFKNKDSVSYIIDVVADEYPQINVEEKTDSVSTKQIYFRGEIKDDYGFKKLNFNYRFVTKNDSSVSEKFKSITTNTTPIIIDKAAVSNPFFYFWDVNKTGVSPGDKIEYYFEVWDNDGVAGSKSARSQKKIFKAPSLHELEEKTEKNNDAIKEELEKSIRQTKNLQKEISDLQRKVAEKKNLSWEEKKKLEDLLNKQKALQQNIEKVKNDNQQNNQQQSEYKQTDETILKKQKQLEELFEKVMTPELKEKMNELQKLLEQMDKNKVQEALEKMKFDTKDLMKELDRNLEVFKQLELEQKLQESIDKLSKLSEKQNELAQKTEEKKTNSEELKQQQEKLNKEFDDVKKDLNELEKKNQELEQPKKIDNTDTQQQDIKKDMDAGAQQLDKKDKKSAAKSQKSAAQKMQELSNKLASQQAAAEKQEQGEDIDKLREILENLIQLSFGQEALMNELSITKPNDPKHLKINQKQNKLRDDAKMIEDSLFALSKRVPQIQAVVNKEISAINMSMEKAVEEITEAPTFSFDGKNHKQEALSRQQFAMTSINNLALMLNEALKQMQEQAKQKGKPGSGSCNKPGGKGEKPSASSLRKMQEQLNEQIKKLKEGMKNEGGEGAQGKPGMSKELARLAAEQETIRKELKKLSDNLNKDGNGGGGLSKLSEKMEETETDLVNKVISQETIKRQEEILTRLLESEKAEKEREQDEKRQSNEAKNENFSNPNEFLEYKGAKKKEAELLKTVPPSLNPFFKAKVNSYFEGFKE
jgi:hypothetical protein